MEERLNAHQLDGVRDNALYWIRQCVNIANAMGGNHQNRVPFFDTQYDARFTGAESYRSALEELSAQGSLSRQYGNDIEPRLLLWLLYDILPRALMLDSDALELAFDEAWTAFKHELNTPYWTFICVTNLGGIVPDSASSGFELAAGVHVATRSQGLIDKLGSSAGLFQQDWQEGSPSELVLLAESQVEKSPDNVLLETDPHLAERIGRAVLAMRLAARGSVRHGAVFSRRLTRFFRSGLATRQGVTSRGFATGLDLLWNEQARRDSLLIYRELEETNSKFKNGWGSISVAIRSYQSALNRGAFEFTDRILDATTAIEALLGDRTETVFKIRMRISLLLGESDDDVAALFLLVGQFYDLRSTLVHGDTLKEKHQKLGTSTDRWLEIARLAIRAFIGIAKADRFPKASEMREQIDALLIHAGQRSRLRSLFSERWSITSDDAIINELTAPRGRLVGFYPDAPDVDLTVMGQRVRK